MIKKPLKDPLSCCSDLKKVNLFAVTTNVVKMLSNKRSKENVPSITVISPFFKYYFLFTYLSSFLPVIMHLFIVPKHLALSLQNPQRTWKTNSTANAAINNKNRIQ